MALPTLVKDWQFDVNNRGGISTSSTQDFAKTMFAIKEALTNFGLNPMTVSRSSNASVATAGDNWATYDDVNWDLGNHSWIVLKAPAGCPVPYEICIAMDDSAWWQTSYIGFSMTGGFNAGAGGTDGTISARPTALDQVQVHAINWGWAGGQSAAHSSMVHGLMSEDGHTMMLIVYINRIPVIVIRHDIIQNPVTGYGIGAGAGMHFWLRFGNSTTTNILSFAESAGSAWKYSLDDVVGLNGSVYFSYESISNTEIACGQFFHGPDAWTGKWPFYPIGVWTAGTKLGRVGTITDMWYSSAAAGQGDVYPDVGSLYQFATVGNLIIPWNGSPLLKA